MWYWRQPPPPKADEEAVEVVEEAEGEAMMAAAAPEDAMCAGGRSTESESESLVVALVGLFVLPDPAPAVSRPAFFIGC